MKSIKFLVFFSFTLVCPSVFAVENICMSFDLNPYRQDLIHSADIASLDLYPSTFSMSNNNSSKVYFVDHGVKTNPDAYNLVECSLKPNYMSCKGEGDTAGFGILFTQDNQVQLHLNFMILSDLDEKLRILRPRAGKSIAIKGKKVTCPKESPEAILF